MTISKNQFLVYSYGEGPQGPEYKKINQAIKWWRSYPRASIICGGSAVFYKQRVQDRGMDVSNYIPIGKDKFVRRNFGAHSGVTITLPLRSGWMTGTTDTSTSSSFYFGTTTN